MLKQKEKDGLSKRSLQSGPSTITADSKFTVDKEFSSYNVMLYEKEIILSTKHNPCTLTSQDCESFIKVSEVL